MIRSDIKNNCIYTYSDIGMKIHGGMPEYDYDEAYDPIDSSRTYTETDMPIGTDDADTDDYLNALKELGVNVDEPE